MVSQAEQSSALAFAVAGLVLLGFRGVPSFAPKREAVTLHIPILQGLAPFRPREALKDALAGVTLASMNIPQVLGYTRIAGTPVVTGLYTVLLPLVGFALFGSSRHLVVAANSATAAIFSSAVSRMAPIASPKYMALVGVLTLLTAGLLLLARIFKFGFLADFLARTALVGFLTGVGVQVGIAMLGEMLGVDVQSHSTLGQLWEVGGGLSRLSPLSLGLSAFVVAVILIGKWLVPRFPVPLVVVVGMIVASAWFDLARRGVAVIGPVPGGLPALRWPDVTWLETLDLLPVAGSCFVMIIAQSAATSRVYAIKHHEHVDENADILGIAAANAGAALTRRLRRQRQSDPDRHGRQRGRAEPVRPARLRRDRRDRADRPDRLPAIPAALRARGVVFTIAIGMIDVKGLKDILSESRGEFWLALSTAAAVPGIGVEQGILLAIGLSLIRHVRHSYRPHTMVLVPDPEGGWLTNPAAPGEQTEPGLILYRFGADLFYANADRFADETRALIESAPVPVKWFVVDAGAITDLDYSAARTLRDLLVELKAKKVSVAFGRVQPSLRSDMERHGIAAIVGPGRIYATLHSALALVDGGKAEAHREK